MEAPVDRRRVFPKDMIEIREESSVERAPQPLAFISPSRYCRPSPSARRYSVGVKTLRLYGEIFAHSSSWSGYRAVNCIEKTLGCKRAAERMWQRSLLELLIQPAGEEAKA